MKSVCLEIVKWKSKEGVSDQDMIASVEGMVSDLRDCRGFINQSLYKDSGGVWVDVYYWDDEGCAHASNEYMADKESFSSLISLIEPDSVSLEVMPLLQTSGNINFE